MTKRFYNFDNLKGLLIFLVVFGHFLELADGYKLLYLIIYSFHMPFFMFISGYFAKFNSKNIFLKLICPYAVFQVLYTYFEIYVLDLQKLTLTFAKPIWLLWYMLAIIVFYLLIPFFDGVPKKKRPLVILLLVVVSLISGYDNKLGYDFSAARIINFIPFFMTGYYMSKSSIKTANGNSKIKYLIASVLGVVFIIATVKILNSGIISKKMLYGSYSYEAAEYDIKLKLLIMIISYIWIALGMILMPDRKIPVLSSIGQCTMPVFLLHGFMVKLADKYIGDEKLSILMVFIFSILVVLIFGNKYVNNFFNIIFMGKISHNKKSGS